MAESIDNAARQRHWAKSRNLTVIVLVIWFIFGYIIPANAKGLNELSFLGFPLGYYFCVQGSLLVFVLLIFFQNFMQDKIDDEANVHSDEVDHSGAEPEPAAAPAPAAAAAPAPEPAPASDPAPSQDAAPADKQDGGQS